MGRRTKKKHREDTPTSPSSSDDDDDDEDTDSSIERRRSRHRHRGRSDGSSRRDKERKRDKEEKRRRRKDRDGERKRRKSKKRRDYESESSASGSALEDREIERVRVNPGDVVSEMLSEFPNVGGDLKQLLQMIDDGQAVDIKGISERSLIKHLKKLFISLNLKENGDRVFLLPPKTGPTLEVVGPLIQACAEPKEQQVDHSIPSRDVDSMPPDAEHKQETDDNNVAVPSSRDDASAPRRTVIGPEMPSAELLAAAAKLTEAQAELREAELEEDTELFIGPAPPAVVAEAASANEAERFEEVTRIMDTVGDSPYDVVGVNRNMSADNLKKRYWKLSLLVHPDKCSHPQAHQAFVKLNKAFKDLQDPEKRKLLDDEIKRKEEQEELKVELRAMREAAQWRRMQVPDDVKVDKQLSEKISLIQQFIRPENLDIKPTFQNETSWLLAQKELQKINLYRAPRDKLVCILNCCKVINNLLLNASMASNENPPGADEFLPVLIYVTIKANPPQLHSNLLYIQRYRCQSRLVGEAAYFLTNILSAESFISNIDAKSLSLEESEFEKNMELARELTGLSTDLNGLSTHSDQNARNNSRAELLESKHRALSSKKERDSSFGSLSSEATSMSKDVQYAKDESPMEKILSLSDIENKGATLLLKEDLTSQVFREYPYLFANVGDLSINDVEDLLNNYKQLVFKYACLFKGLGVANPSLPLTSSKTQVHGDVKTLNYDQDTTAVGANNESGKHTVMADGSNMVSLVDEENVELKPRNHEESKAGEPNDESQTHNGITDDSNLLSLVGEEILVSKPTQNEAMVPQYEGKDENSQ